MHIDRITLARHLAAEGFCVLPLLADSKVPAVKWKRLQEERPTDAELVEWFEANDHEPGIVTGKISGITVIDCDSPEAEAAWLAAHPGSPVTQATRRGRHLVFRWLGESNTRGIYGMAGVDRRGEGGYVRAYADSIHWTREAVNAAPFAPYVEHLRPEKRQTPARYVKTSKPVGPPPPEATEPEYVTHDGQSHRVLYRMETKPMVLVQLGEFEFKWLPTA